MTACLAALMVLLTAALVPAPAVAFAPITVTVKETTGIEHHRWPLGLSVPFMRGELRPGTAIKVVDEHGMVGPVQSRVLAQWPDGSVRWCRIDTAVDLRPGREHRLRIESGAAAKAPMPVGLTETEDGIAIDTGALRFTVPTKRLAIVDGLRPAGREQAVTGAMGAVLVAGEQSGQAQPPTRVTIVDRGPLRARIELQGTYGNNFDYLIRLEAYAGQPWVRVWHTFIDRHPTPYVSLARLAIELPLIGESVPSHYRYGVVGARPGNGDLTEGEVHLYQSDNESYAVAGESETGKLAGWVELGGEGPTIGVAARWMWQEYPQSFVLQRNRLVYNLWAPEADPAKTGVGAAKTHEFVVSVGMTSGAAAGLVRPLVGVVDPAWVAHTGALPQAVTPHGSSAAFVRKAAEAARRYAQRNDIERWNECGAVRCEPQGFERPRTGAYGMWNWGDWNFRGYQDTTKGTDSWGNLEYDTAYVLALAYAASGDAEVYDLMTAAARHFIDVDTIHACPARSEWVGMNHPKNPLHFSFELGGPDLGHTWTQGALAYFYLSGDERGLSAARGIADYLVDRVRSVALGNPRQWGWPQIALLAVYDATGERRYLDAAVLYAQGGMRAHPPTASTQWKLGILADALAYTHAATSDQAIRTWLEQYAAAVMKRKAREDVRAFPAVAYVAGLSGDAAMRDAARTRADRLDLGSWGKPFSINGRIGFRIESLLAMPAPPTPHPTHGAAHK